MSIEAADRQTEPSPWGDRRFLIFAAGNTLNNIGEAIYAVALPLLVYDLTGSLALMSVLAAAVPATLLLGPWLGSFVDRWGPRVMVLPGLIVQLAAAVVLNVTGLGRGTAIGLLFALAVLVQLGGVVYQTGWMTGVASMFPANPGRARGSLGSLFVATRIAGALLFALSLHRLGYLGLLWINVATFLAPIAVWCLGIRPPRPRATAARSAPRILPSMAEGWRILRRSRAIVNATAIEVPLAFVSSVGTVTLAMFCLRDSWHLGAGTVATILMVSRVGGLAGTLVVSQRRELAARSAYAITTVGAVACLFAMAMHVLSVQVAALVLMSALQGARAVTGQMMVFTYLPGSAIGRVSGFLNLIEGIPMFVAPLVIPAVAAGIGIEHTFAALGAIGVAAVFWLARSWLDWSPDEEEPREEETHDEDGI